jgi:hypothetical protein
VGSCVTDSHNPSHVCVRSERGAKHYGGYRGSLATRPHKNCPRLSHYKVVTHAFFFFSCICSLILILCNKPFALLWPCVNSDSNRNEYQNYFLMGKGGRCVGLTILPSSSTKCLEIWELQLPGTIMACPDLYRDCFTFAFTSFIT